MRLRGHDNGEIRLPAIAERVALVRMGGTRFLAIRRSSMKADARAVRQFAIALVWLLSLCGAPVRAQPPAEPPPPPVELPRPPAEVPGITPELLVRTVVPGAPGKIAIAQRVTYQPGARNRKHYHTSQVIFYVLEGAMTVQDDGKDPVTLKAGDALLVK